MSEFESELPPEPRDTGDLAPPPLPMGPRDVPRITGQGVTYRDPETTRSPIDPTQGVGRAAVDGLVREPSPIIGGAGDQRSRNASLAPREDRAPARPADRVYEGQLVDRAPKPLDKHLSSAIAGGGKAVILGDNKPLVREEVGKTVERFVEDELSEDEHSLAVTIDLRPTKPGEPSYLAERAANAHPDMLQVKTMNPREVLGVLKPEQLATTLAMAAGGRDPRVTDTYNRVLHSVVGVLSTPSAGAPPETKPRTPDVYEVRDGVRVLCGAQLPNQYNAQPRNEVPFLRGPGGSEDVEEISETIEGILETVGKDFVETHKAQIHSLGQWLDGAYPDSAVNEQSGPTFTPDPSVDGAQRTLNPHATVLEVKVSGHGPRLDKQRALGISAVRTIVAESTPWGSQPKIVAASNLDLAGPEHAGGLLETCEDQELPAVVTLSRLTAETAPLIDGAKALSFGAMGQQQAKVLSEQVLPTVKRALVVGSNLSISGGRGDSVNVGANTSFDRIPHTPAGGGTSGGASDTFNVNYSRAQNVEYRPGPLGTTDEVIDVKERELALLLGNTAVGTVDIDTGVWRPFPPPPDEEPMQLDQEIRTIERIQAKTQLRDAQGGARAIEAGNGAAALPQGQKPQGIGQPKPTNVDEYSRLIVGDYLTSQDKRNGVSLAEYSYKVYEKECVSARIEPSKQHFRQWVKDNRIRLKF